MAIHSLDTIISVNGPAIPGLRYRHYQGDSDLQAFVPLLTTCRAADRIDYHTTLEDLRHNFSNLLNCDLDHDMVVVEIEGQVIGFNRVMWQREQNGDYNYYHNGQLHPAWRGKGIGSALLHTAENRLREIAAAHTVTGRKLLRTRVQEHQTDWENLITQEGYAPIRYFFEMTRPLSEPIPEAPLPPGLEVRPVLPNHYHPIWDAANEAFQDHWGEIEHTEAMYEEFMSNRLCDPTLWRVAWDGDQIAGMVLNFYDPDENQQFNRLRGYTEGISVRRPWRKIGLARALIVRSLHMFKSMGMTEAALGVDAENLSGALGLYESVGFRAISRMAIYQKEL